MRLFCRQLPRPVSPTSDPGGGEIYAAFIKSQLDYEQSRRSALEARASSIITSSGVLVTLLFGLVAVITKATNFRLPQDSHVWLVAAVLMFVVATGISIVMPLLAFPYATPEFDSHQITQVWTHSTSIASANIAKAQLVSISTARQSNRHRALLIFYAGVFELLALITLAVAVILIITK